MRKFFHKTAPVVLAVSGLALSGCATGKNPNDPYESYNRKVFTFNMMMDHYVLRPIAVGYVNYVPDPVRYVVTNFYNNLRDFVSLGDDILQLDGMDSMQTTMRIALNSTFGLLGMIDVASSMGLPQHKNTFGNTMKRWGWTNSSYFMIPLYGPGTVRDQLGLIPDIWFNPTWYVIDDYWISGGLFAVNLIDARSKYLGQDQLLEQALDPYATIRDIYLQHNGEYIYPKASNESAADSDNVDSLIAEENGQPPAANTNKSNNDDVDALIAEENAKMPATSITASPVTSSEAKTPATASTISMPATTTTTDATTLDTNATSTNDNADPHADVAPATSDIKAYSPQQKTNLRTFDGKTIYTD